MAQSSADWLESQADRAFSRQRAQVDTAKLVGTFTAGLSGTLVATALQVGSPNNLDLGAVIVLALAFVGVIVVILLDRIAEADQAAILEESRIRGWDDEAVVRELRIATLAAVHVNAGVVGTVRLMLGVQVAFSIAAATLASISLLR